MPRFDWNGQSKVHDFIETYEEVKIYINGQSSARLTGYAPRVVIEVVDGQSYLDLSDFKTKEAVLLGKVDGQSQLFLSSTGKVEFLERIDGQSLVVICAGGPIIFSNAAAKIDGQSRMFYSSPGPIQGPLVNGSSSVFFQGRALAFDKVDGKSVVVPLPGFLSLNCAKRGEHGRDCGPEPVQVEHGPRLNAVPNLEEAVSETGGNDAVGGHSHDSDDMGPNPA